MNENLRTTLSHALKATSYILILKGAVAGSVMTFAVFGVAVPYVGPFLHIAPTDFNEGIAASLGAVFGVIAAFKA